MNLDLDPGRFQRELGGWTVRVVLCGLPSALLAALEFHAPFELAAMAAGAALWVVGAAAFCASVAMQATPGREQFVRALKMAAWVKAALLPVAACGLGMSCWLKVDGAACLMLVLLPDVFAGLGSLWLVGLLAGSESFVHLHGFGGILAATVMQGALLSLGVAGLAGAISSGTKVRRWWARQKASPASIWG